jgi:CDP-diacylglycerol--glycerol-3-phosphate 3-phosphatidyltransferase
MNLPNKLTLARLVLTVIFVVALSVEVQGFATLALLLFIVAGITDYADGAIARAQNLITDFGKLMDPLADKIMVSSAFILLAARQQVPAWIVVVIVGREFLITGLRLLAGAKGIVLPAERMGKHKTVWQIITAVYFLGILALKDWIGANADSHPYRDAVAGAGWALLFVTALLTVGSGLGYLWKNRSLLETR